MLKPRLFEILKSMEACPESISYLESCHDVTRAVQGLRPDWTYWLAMMLYLPAWEARRPYEEALLRDRDEATITALRVYWLAVQEEILSWYEGL